MASDNFRLLKAGSTPKETPSGSDDLLEHYGLSGIYKLFTVRGHDTYLKGLPADSDFRRGNESMELTGLATLNPLRTDIAPLTPLQLMPFKLQAKPVPTLLSETDLGHAVNLDALRVKANALAATPPAGAKLKKDKKDKKQKKEKKDRGSKRKGSEEPSDGTTTRTGMPSGGTSSGAVRIRIKQPRLG